MLYCVFSERLHCCVLYDAELVLFAIAKFLVHFLGTRYCRIAVAI